MCKKPNKNELAKIANHLLLSLRLLKTSPLNKSSSNIGAKTTDWKMPSIRHHYLDNLQNNNWLAESFDPPPNTKLIIILATIEIP